MSKWTNCNYDLLSCNYDQVSYKRRVGTYMKSKINYD